MAARECYHCKQWIEDFKTHDCWTTTEEALLDPIDDDLRDAYHRIRETALECGEQRIYASHRSIMFALKHCYFFVRPTKKRLEVCLFLPRLVKHPFVKKTYSNSKTKTAHMIHVVHRDEVESPIVDWIGEAYSFAANPPTKAKPQPKTKRRKPKARKPKKASRLQR